MKKLVTMLACLVAATGAFAQEITTADPDFDSRARLSIGLDKQLFKGFHLGLEEEMRFDDNFGSFDSSRSTLSADWKMTRHLKVGAGYTYIYGTRTDKKDPASFTPDVSHRWYGEVTGMWKANRWRLSVRERFQSTTLTREVNKFQEPQTAYALRTRFKASYDVLGKPIKPYASVELRHALNGLTYKLVEDVPTYSYSDIYLNRTRGTIGVEWKCGRRSELDIYAMGDYVFKKKFDANKDGTKMKSITYKPGYRATIGVGYKINF